MSRAAGASPPPAGSRQAVNAADSEVRDVDGDLSAIDESLAGIDRDAGDNPEDGR